MLYASNESQKTEEKGHILKKNYCKNDLENHFWLHAANL